MFQAARESLSSESRQLVTASKQLVRSVTDSIHGPDAAELPTHLSSCLTLLRRLTQLSGDLARHTSCPLQTRNLVLKVRQVATEFRATLDTDLPSTQLASRAEDLAAGLAALLRALRVFSP